MALRAEQRQRGDGGNAFAGANARFRREFLERHLGFGCDVCERMWFDNNLATIDGIQSPQQRSNAMEVLTRWFPPAPDVGQFRVSGTCKESLIKASLPNLSTANGYVYPLIPSHLPRLNVVEERLVARRLPFMCIRQLTQGNGQYAIKGQVVNVPIKTENTLKCLPRNIADDIAIEVHIKRRLLAKPTYKQRLV